MPKLLWVQLRIRSDLHTWKSMVMDALDKGNRIGYDDEAALVGSATSLQQNWDSDELGDLGPVRLAPKRF
jgi:hypothetical protein